MQTVGTLMNMNLTICGKDTARMMEPLLLKAHIKS